MPSKVMKKPSIRPGAMSVVTARTCAQFRTSEMEVISDPAANNIPKEITAGLIPSTNSFGKASVKIVLDGAKERTQTIVTKMDIRKK